MRNVPRGRRRHRPPMIAVLAIVLSLAVPAAGQAQSLEQARAERAAVQHRLDKAATDLNELETRIAELEAEQEALASEVRSLSSQATEATRRVSARVRTVYMHGTSDPLLELISGVDPQQALDAAARVDQLVRGDRDGAEVALAARTRAGAAADELAIRETDLDATRTQQAVVLDALQADLQNAAALEARLEAEQRRRQEEAARVLAAQNAAAAAAAAAAVAVAANRPAPAPAPATGGTSGASAPAAVSGGVACPVGNPHSFTDTWGAPRSGGRRHQGVDILSPYGTPVNAFVGGTYDIRKPGSLAGNWAMLRGDDGNTYYYMHLTKHVVGDGARVSAGQQVGTIGDTGNARGTPHLHWEVHPGGGGAVNPTPYARRGCG